MCLLTLLLHVLCLLKVVVLTELNDEDEVAKVLVVPAKKFCDSPEAEVDDKLQACVTTDHHISMLPQYLPCPEGSILSGRHCLGEILVDPEQACPLTYDFNRKQQCIRAHAYSPLAVICPVGFRLVRRVETKIDMCVRHENVHPIYSISENAPECGNAKNTSSCPMEIACPSGSSLHRRRTTSAADDAFNRSGKKERDWVCVSKIVAPPDSTSTCMTQFAWSPSVKGCLNLELQNPKFQCPEPNMPPIGKRGDLSLPDFIFDPVKKKCVAEHVPAIFPQCPPGYALQGPLNRKHCYKKIFSPLHYDCRNAEGFTFKWDNTTGLATCEFRFSMKHFTNSAQSYRTIRNTINAGWMRGTIPNSWQVIKNYEEAHESKQSAKIKEDLKSALLAEQLSQIIANSSTITTQRKLKPLIYDRPLHVSSSPGQQRNMQSASHQNNKELLETIFAELEKKILGEGEPDPIDMFNHIATLNTLKILPSWLTTDGDGGDESLPEIKKQKEFVLQRMDPKERSATFAASRASFPSWSSSSGHYTSTIEARSPFTWSKKQRALP